MRMSVHPSPRECESRLNGSRYQHVHVSLNDLEPHNGHFTLFHPKR